MKFDVYDKEYLIVTIQFAHSNKMKHYYGINM